MYFLSVAKVSPRFSSRYVSNNSEKPYNEDVGVGVGVAIAFNNFQSSKIKTEPQLFSFAEILPQIVETLFPMIIIDLQIIYLFPV